MPQASTSIASRRVTASFFRGHSPAASGRSRAVLLIVGGTLAVLLLLPLLPPPLLPLLRNMGSLLHLQEIGPAGQAQISQHIAKDSVTTRTADGGYICRAVDESNGRDWCVVAGEMLAEAGGESVRRTAVANGNDRETQAARIPFFGNGNAESMRGVASHLDHRVDEYRQELVKVMQGLDLIVNGLEEAAAKVGTGGRDLPAQGVRRLAAKLKQKMDKTPPLWQVNTDVLAWLLRPVPFVTGLPAPAPTPPTSFSSTPRQNGGCDSASAVAECKAQDTGMVTEPVEERRPAPFVHGGGATATLAEDLSGRGPGQGGGEGGEQEMPSSNRAGFHSYDETHQIFTHMLRDWTSEGDSVRAAVYDPLLQALDHWVGWQEGATARAAPPATEAGTRGGSRGEIRARQRKRRGQPKPSRVRRPANVLVPGAGLGRLAAEIAAREYASVHANELSMTMLASCYWVMEALRGDRFSGPGPSPSATPASEWDGGGGEHPWSRPPAVGLMSDRNYDAGRGGDCGSACGRPGYARNGGGGSGGGAPGGWGNGNERGARGAEGDGGADGAGKVARGFFEFYPFLNDAAHNEVDGEARFRPVQFPDPDGRTALARAYGRLSFQAGEFSATYGAVGGPFEGSFDAVVTSFFVDTAPNVVEYVATIRRALRPGGVWINCGPLHWHNHSALALSLDEMLALVAGSGFQLEVVERLPACAYRVEDGGGSLRVDEFKPVFWVAILRK